MGATWGEKFKVTLFGESHGAAIGVVIDVLPAGFKPDLAKVDAMMARRSAKGREKLATARREGDEYEIVSGYFDGACTGTPLCAVIRNKDTHSPDYERMRFLMRPGHSDWGYFVKEKGFNDYRGGGHSSGRLTAPLVFAGALAMQLLEEKGIKIGAHIAEIAGEEDERFDPVCPQIEKILPCGTLSEKAWERMRAKVLEAAERGDSVGGVIECAVTGVPAGAGDPLLRQRGIKDSAYALFRSRRQGRAVRQGLCLGAHARERGERSLPHERGKGRHLHKQQRRHLGRDRYGHARPLRRGDQAHVLHLPRTGHRGR